MAVCGCVCACVCCGLLRGRSPTHTGRVCHRPPQLTRQTQLCVWVTCHKLLLPALPVCVCLSRVLNRSPATDYASSRAFAWRAGTTGASLPPPNQNKWTPHSHKINCSVANMNPSSGNSSSQPPAINFATDWLDELGCVCPKNVDYATQCPKGHALAPFDASGEPPAKQPSDREIICRACHGSTQRQLVCGWLTCSVAGCCAGYAVCAACVIALGCAPKSAAASTDNFCMMVMALGSLPRTRTHLSNMHFVACVY